MKKYFFLFFVWMTLPLLYAEGKTLKDFSEILESLKSGKSVKVVIEYGKCQLISNNEIKAKSPQAIGGMIIETFEYFDKNAIGNANAFIVASESKLIENPLGEGYVYNYAKVKISDDGTIRLTARYVDAVSYEDIMDESFYTTIKNNNDGAATFYLIN